MAECTDKPPDHDKRMSSRQALDIHGIEVRARPKYHQSMYLANAGVVGPWLEVREGMVWRWGEGKTYFGVPAQIFLRVMSCWHDLPPKRSKDELESLGA